MVDVVEHEQLVLGEVEDLVARSGVNHQLHVDNSCHKNVDGDRLVVTYPGRSLGRGGKRLVVLHGRVNVPLPVLMNPLFVQDVGVRQVRSVAVHVLDVLAEDVKVGCLEDVPCPVENGKSWCPWTGVGNQSTWERLAANHFRVLSKDNSLKLPHDNRVRSQGEPLLLPAHIDYLKEMSGG